MIERYVVLFCRVTGDVSCNAADWAAAARNIGDNSVVVSLACTIRANVDGVRRTLLKRCCSYSDCEDVS